MILYRRQRTKPSQRKRKARRKSDYRGGFTNSRRTKRSKKQRRGGKVHPINTEFQKIARRDKKSFFSEYCLVLEENNKRGKTRDLFRKVRNIKGIFCPKMGTIKDRSGRDLADRDLKTRSRRD